MGSLSSAARGLQRLRLAALVGVAFLMAGCAHTGLQPRGFRPSRSTAEVLSRALEPRRVALVIGIDDYQNPVLPDLRYAGADARKIAELLLSPDGGRFDRVELLVSGDRVTRDSILRALRTIRGELLEEDTFVLYFSGHGTLAETEKGKGRLYLLPSDATPADLEESALDLEVIREYLGSLPAERKALIVDACFHGEGKSVVDPELAPGLVELLESTPQTQVRGLSSGEAHMFASTLGRPAFEDPDLGHGVYTHYLIQAMTWRRTEADLNDDGLLTAWEAHDFARGRTQQHTDGRQVAEASFRLVGENDLLLAGDPNAASDSEHALLYNYEDKSGLFAASTLLVDGTAKGIFPGTFTVPGGRHHLEVRGPDGGLKVDGYIDLKAGQAVSAKDLGVLVREDRALQAIRVGFGGGPAQWGPLWGDGFVAIEGWAALRVPRGPAKGLFVGGTFGGGVSPTRRDLERLTEKGRGVFWFAGEGGWGTDVQRLRLRAAWQVRLNLLPLAVLPGPAHPLLPEETGWLFGSTGPVLHVGLILDRRMSLVAAGTVHLTYLDPSRLGAPKAQAFGQVTMGLELGF